MTSLAMPPLKGPPPKASPRVPKIALKIGGTVKSHAVTSEDQNSQTYCLRVSRMNWPPRPSAISSSPCVMPSICAMRQARPSSGIVRSEEHTSKLQSLMRTSYAVFCLKKKNKHNIMQQEREDTY